MFIKRSMALALTAAALLMPAAAHASFSLPIQGSDVAVSWDHLYDFLLWLSVFFFVLVIGGMVYFMIRYRHQTGTKPKYMTGNVAVEAVGVVVPTILLMVIFGWGWIVYHNMAQAPSDAYEVKVVGRQWKWQFLYDNGRSTDYLFVELGKPVKLVMSSNDVIHSMFIPSFRIKQDVVPGMYSSVWFEPKVPGRHQIFCAEYCGTSHSGMLSKAIVLTSAQWKQFQDGKEFREEDFPDAGISPVASAQSAAVRPVTEIATSGAGAGNNDALHLTAAHPTQSLASRGHDLFTSKGCVACHTVDGSNRVGPTIKGLYNSRVELIDGSMVLADDNYLRESIEKPQAKIVKGFQPVMPTFLGQLDERDMSSLIAFIKTQK